MIKVLPLLLSRFSRVQLCATPQMAAHQAPSSLKHANTVTLAELQDVPTPFPSGRGEALETELINGLVYVIKP